MSEEIKNASRIVPGAMIFSLIVNGLLGFGMLIAILFCLGDVDAVLDTATGYPFMAIFQEGVQSLGGATTMSVIVTALVVCASISVVASASRMTWSFARDRGLPGWRWLSKVCHSYIHIEQSVLFFVCTQVNGKFVYIASFQILHPSGCHCPHNHSLLLAESD